jgi:hypothetical protein
MPGIAKFGTSGWSFKHDDVRQQVSSCEHTALLYMLPATLRHAAVLPKLTLQA